MPGPQNDPPQRLDYRGPDAASGGTPAGAVGRAIAAGGVSGGVSAVVGLAMSYARYRIELRRIAAIPPRSPPPFLPPSFFASLDLTVGQVVVSCTGLACATLLFALLVAIAWRRRWAPLRVRWWFVVTVAALFWPAAVAVSRLVPTVVGDPAWFVSLSAGGAVMVGATARWGVRPGD